jgi:uncharacterized repeat protein (TIGR01451 family)
MLEHEKEGIMKRQKNSNLNVFLIVMAVVLLILAIPNTGLTRSAYLAANHHTGQFDAWNVDPFGTPTKQWTLGLSYATDPAGIAVHEEWNAGVLDWSAVFITSEFSGGVEVVDPRSLTTLGISSGPSDLAGIDVHDDTYIVYSVQRMTNKLYIFQYDPVAIAINQIDLIYLPGCSQAMGIALDESRDTLWVADTASGIVRAYDINTWIEDAARSFASIHQPVDVAVDRARNVVYTVSIIGGAWVPPGTGSTYLSKYDVGTGVETTTDMGFPGVGVAVDEIWNIVYVTGGASWGDNLTSWDTTTNPFTMLYDTGWIGNPAGIAIGPGIDPGLNLAKNWIIQGTGVHIGEIFTYVITFDSPAIDLIDVVITDVLPTELDFVSATEGGVYDLGTHTVVWDLGNISVGQDVPTLYLDVKVNQNAVVGQTIHNYCQFECNELPPISPPEPPAPPEVEPNQPPSADPNGPYLSPLDICFDGTDSSDPEGDPLTYDWDFGDGNTGTGETPCHTYDNAGIYDVCLTVNDGLVDSETVCTSAVIYDPDAGFVTGGGWFDSLEGAYVPDPSLTGKANFGFVSKYKKGATAPTGQTEFHFQTADLNFHSDSYNWLVVTGNNFARFKGSGTINGTGNYKFMLWAGDDDPDTFRIRIWEEDEFGNETDIYDNGFDQPLGGGSIVIHTK